MEILGIKFAPFNVPLKRRLETLSVTVWVVLIITGNFLGYVLAGYLLLYTQYVRYLMPIYFLYMYYDWDTCNKGGRSERWCKWLRNSAWMRNYCDYFPLKLVKTTDLDPTRNYLFCSVPHGIMSSGICGAFSSDFLGCKQLFPGLEIRVVILDQHFKVPFFREYAYMTGAVSSSSESLNYQLSTKPLAPYTGKITILIVGGASESLECQPGTYRTLVKKRKGFIKLALKHGTPLVPVIPFGETDLYDQFYRPEGTSFRKFQHYVRKIIGLAPVVLKGRGLFQYSFGVAPHRRPITVVVGSPLDVPKVEEPTREQIDEYHEKFIKHTIDLFETQKHKYIKNAESVKMELLS